MYWEEGDLASVEEEEILPETTEKEILPETTENVGDWLQQNGFEKIRIGADFQADVSVLLGVDIHEIEGYHMLLLQIRLF